jgi:hypothetical protein
MNAIETPSDRLGDWLAWRACIAILFLVLIGLGL